MVIYCNSFLFALTSPFANKNNSQNNNQEQDNDMTRSTLKQTALLAALLTLPAFRGRLRKRKKSYVKPVAATVAA